MRRALALTVITAALVCSAILVIRYWPDAYWQPLQHQLEKTYGITIALDNIEFPPSFRTQKAKYRETLPIERASVLKRLELDLSRYPRAFINQHLNGIVILRSLEMNGLHYGGTYDLATGTLYIDSGWLGDDGSMDEAMGLHHELSSLLMWQNPDVFKLDDWAALNPKEFQYQYSRSSSANLTTKKLDLSGNAETWEQGFLCGYGLLTLEDDINTFAQYLVANKTRWPELMRSYPVLASKMQLLTRWYCEIGFSPNAGECTGTR